MGHLVIQGDARHIPLGDRSVHAVVTSSPYFNLRDYKTGTWVGGDSRCDHRMGRQTNRNPGESSAINGSAPTAANVAAWSACGKCGAKRVDLQIGLEETPALFCAEMVKVGRELWRVLRDDGVLFWNIGESFAGSWGNQGRKAGRGTQRPIGGPMIQSPDERYPDKGANTGKCPPGLKPKDIMGIPYRLAMALQADGWYWRDTIIWAKAEVDDDDVLEGSGMPGSQDDRCTFGYEVVLQLTKSPRYYFDIHGERSSSGATLRNVWRINTEPNRLGHFALMPRKLAERCIRLGTSERGCCPDCLAPWRRLVDRDRTPTRTGNDSKVGRVSDHDESPYHGQNGSVVGNRDPRRHTTSFRTTGWEPTCLCGVDRTAPCRVLDPFGGLSTTAVSASAVGRIGITIDLSREYCGTAKNRLDRPHAPVAKPSKSDDVEDMPMFRHHR